MTNINSQPLLTWVYLSGFFGGSHLEQVGEGGPWTEEGDGDAGAKSFSSQRLKVPLKKDQFNKVNS